MAVLSSSLRRIAGLIALTLFPAAPLAAIAFFPATVPQLIADIQTANTDGAADVIDLGGATFLLTAVDNLADGENALPSVTESFPLEITNGTIDRGGAPGASFRYLHVAATGDLRLSNLTLRGGFVQASGNGEPLGGAVFNRGQLSATNVTFEDNVADSFNGLLAGSEAQGGAIFNAASGTISSLVDCTFSNNTAVGGGAVTFPVVGGRGGAIYNSAGAIGSIVRCEFSNNSAGGAGGSILFGPAAGEGGAIVLDGGTVTVLSDCLFSFNHADSATSGFFPTANSRGGAILLRSGASIGNLASSTFFENAAADGGAIAAAGSTLSSVANSTFSGNSAEDAGGAFHLDATSSLDLRNSTLTQNGAEVRGGGIDCAGTIVTLASTIVAANSTGSIAPDIFLDGNSGVLVSADFNLVGTDQGHPIVNGVNNNQVGTLATPLDPLVGPLATNGGPTSTHALLAGSPALDSGANSLSLAFDQRGNPFARTSNGATDIGAFELQVGGDLGVTKSDLADPVLAGAQVVYTITVANAGPDDASDVTLDDPLPAGTTFVSLSSPGGWSCTTPAVGSGGTVSCSVASLGVGSAVFTLTVAADPSLADGTVLSNTATTGSTTTDPSPGNEQATETTTVTTRADLSVAKVDTPDPVLAGANLTYTITVGNAGPHAAAGVTLDDTLPAGTTFVSLSSPGGWSCSTPAVGSGGTVSCSIASLGTGNAAFTLVVAVGSSLADGSVITNTATVASTTADPNSGNEGFTATTTVENGATLSATKTVGGSFSVGGGVTYTIVLANAGPGAQADNPGDEFIDVLPSTLVLAAASATAGTATADPGTNTVTWNGSLAAGGAVTITITATILPVAEGQIVSNQGAIAFDADGDGSNESSAPTDDPGLPGQADATAFAVSLRSVIEVPTLSSSALALLAALLAAAGVSFAARRGS